MSAQGGAAAVAEPLALVIDAIGKVAAGVEVDFGALRQRVARVGALVHPALRSDAPPGVDGLLRDDSTAPLLLALDDLEQRGPEAASDRLQVHLSHASHGSL